MGLALPGQKTDMGVQRRLQGGIGHPGHRRRDSADIPDAGEVSERGDQMGVTLRLTQSGIERCRIRGARSGDPKIVDRHRNQSVRRLDQTGLQGIGPTLGQTREIGSGREDRVEEAGDRAETRPDRIRQGCQHVGGRTGPAPWKGRGSGRKGRGQWLRGIRHADKLV